MNNELSNNLSNDVKVEVLLAPISGDFYGSSSLDGTPIKETIEESDIDNMVKNFDKPVLMDTDHSSTRIDGSTRAFGWIKQIWKSAKGLAGELEYTLFGKSLKDSKEYKYISPTFDMKDGHPFKLVSAAATNTPAIDGLILNSKPKENLTKDINNMTTTIKDENTKEVVAENKKACNQEDAMTEKKPLENPVKEDLSKKTCKNEDMPEEDKMKEEVQEDKMEEEGKPDDDDPIKILSERLDKTEEVLKTIIDSLDAMNKKSCNECKPEVPVKEDKTEKPKEVIDVKAMNAKPISIPLSLTQQFNALQGKDADDFLKVHGEELLKENM